ncbi:MAG: hypothetical protein QM783_00420 [Phycisphaerales bacterium]
MRATLTSEERTTIEQAIEAAERRTAAEFIVIIAGRSASYRRAEDAFGLIAAFVLTVGVSLAIPVYTPSGSWFSTRPAPLGLFGTLALFIVLAVAGAWLASRSPAIIRALTPRGKMAAAVRRRATECFSTFRVRPPDSRPAVLVYVSLLERSVWITADDAVLVSLGAGSPLWAELRDKVTGGYRDGRGPAAIAQALLRAAEALATPLPPRSAPGQIANRVHLLNA